MRSEIEPDRRHHTRALAFMAGAATALLVSFLGVRAQSSWRAPLDVGVDQLLTRAPVGGPARVSGEIVAGSFVRRDPPCELTFLIERNGFRMPVRLSSCIVSDPLEAALKDGGAVPVTIEGTPQASGFLATDVFAHVPSCCYCTPEAYAARIRAWREASRGQPERPRQ